VGNHAYALNLRRALLMGGQNRGLWVAGGTYGRHGRVRAASAGAAWPRRQTNCSSPRPEGVFSRHASRGALVLLQITFPRPDRAKASVGTERSAAGGAEFRLVPRRAPDRIRQWRLVLRVNLPVAAYCDPSRRLR